MSNYAGFKGAFDERYSSIKAFIDSADSYETIPWGGRLEEESDARSFSWLENDSALKRIFYFEKFDVYVAFEGNYGSYNGEVWNDMYEVILAPITILQFQKV